MKLRRKAIVIAAVMILALILLADCFHVGGDELSWAALAGGEAVITVEEDYKGSGKILATHTLTRGQGVALQSLLLRTHYLRRFGNTLRLKNDSNTYRIFIRFPARDVSISLSEGVNGWYLGGAQDRGWLKILDKDWNTAFQGILAAG